MSKGQAFTQTVVFWEWLMLVTGLMLTFSLLRTNWYPKIPIMPTSIAKQRNINPMLMNLLSILHLLLCICTEPSCESQVHKLMVEMQRSQQLIYAPNSKELYNLVHTISKKKYDVNTKKRQKTIVLFDKIQHKEMTKNAIIS